MREGHAHVATFLKEYEKVKKPPAGAGAGQGYGQGDRV